ncbi:MAG: beta-lactamase family protein, partial [Acidobacteria bacterium]|nr:beta-lactamase family protein [Acidobacteriota bacterium]
MSHRLRHTIVLVAIVVGVSAHLAAQTVPMPAEYRPVRDYIEQGLAAGLSPSVAVAVVKDGRVIWAEGFGLADRERGIKATADTIYLLASGSKPLTATGVMALVDRNLIDLDRPANQYLPGAKLRAYAGSADDITVRRLVSHSSGLPAYFDYLYPGDSPLSPDETIRRYGFAVTPPGSQYGYSNLNFALLSFIVEAVTRTPWRQFQEKTIYDPLGMRRTSDRVRPGREQEAAAPYLQDAAGRFIRVPDYMLGHQGASHIRTTANDLGRFALMHLQGGAVGGVRILSDASVRAMQKVTTENPPGSAQGYGLGWMINPALGRPTVRHDGNMPGVATVLRLYPEDRAATIVLTNTTTSTMVVNVTTELGRVILNRPAPANAAPSPPPPPPPAAPRIPPDVLEGFVGTWQGTLAHHDGDVAVRLVISSKG